MFHNQRKEFTVNEQVRSPPRVADIVEKYMALRAKRDVLKKAFDAEVADIDTAMTRVENYLLRDMQERGVESEKTPFGTPYITTRTSATVADWGSFLGFVRANDEWDMLKRDVAKAIVVAWRTEHNDLPPGLNWREEKVVNIRKS